jgi:hypothetical protein
MQVRKVRVGVSGPCDDPEHRDIADLSESGSGCESESESEVSRNEPSTPAFAPL